MNTTSPATCYIALGSNLDSPLSQVTKAVNTLNETPSITVTACSPWYQSTAIGPGDQPDYVNGVVSIETQLSAIALLDVLQAIEAEHGRERHTRWGARTLDLDLLLYGDCVIDTERLQVPHPRMTERNFVLYPLSDIACDLRLPNGTTIESLLASTSTEGLAIMSAKTVNKTDSD